MNHNIYFKKKKNIVHLMNCQLEPILPLNQEITTDNYNKNDIKSILPLNQEITTNMDVEFGDFKKAPIKPTVYTLLEKIEELEKRIENLEKNK